MTAVEDAKRRVIEAGIKLMDTGLIARTWGNVSHRIDGGQFVITPSGRDYGSLTPEDIVTVRISDCSYSGTIKPSSEKGVHAEVYKRFPDVHFVIHTHQEYASVISACHVNAIPVDVGLLAGQVLCGAYALPSTKKLQRNVAKALAHTNNQAIIMKNHGAVCYGANDAEAFKAALELDQACRQYLDDTYKTLTGESLADPAQISRFALGLGSSAPASASSHDGTPAESKLYHSRRLEDGFVLFDDAGSEIQVRYDELDGAMPEEAWVYQQIYRSHKGIHHIRWSGIPEVKAYSLTGKPLKPLLDDFAQLIGTSAKSVELSPAEVSSALKKSSAALVRGMGALCCGSTFEDAIAAGMVLEKNCKAHIGAKLLGQVKPIHYLESLLMRFVYLKKYSKQAAVIS
ncbi:class II aldolase/adducin family protein [Paenibacillus glycanilyticus]|uniref:class II aldolase/adducin family protein n=1 Tax=Paenibacillus glycanilyticus TaxID=126569 RepID=UPI00203B6FE4|nr:class II aldolase/adducin family protein [Paenibacillus glycanilyticus]MCM3626962.1 class II aldolase/adducin family protein [Paenibacillus glycanilyticus]